MSPAEFSSLFEAPLKVQLEQLNENGGRSRRQVLDAVEPGVLFRKMAEGARSAKSAYAEYLSSETYGLIDAFLSKAKQECEQAKPAWAQLDHYDRNGVWEGMKASYGSGETAVGAAIGDALFGTLGAVIGGAIGGWAAGSRVEEHFQKGMQEYINWLINWGQEFDDELQNRICPAVQRDLERPRPVVSTPRLPAAKQAREKKSNKLGFVLFGSMILLGLSVAGWAYYGQQGVRNQTAPPSAVNTNGRLADLQGKWLGDSSRGYDAVLVGDTLEFRLHGSLDSLRDGYQSGEMHFRLRRSPEGDTVFVVEQKVRPLLPASWKYGRESLDSCQELITTVGTRSLKAQLVDGRLSIDLAKVLATLDFVELRRGQVVNCKSLPQNKISKIQIALTRLASGQDFPETERVSQFRKIAPRGGTPRTSPQPLAATTDEQTPLATDKSSLVEKHERTHSEGAN